MKKLLLILGTLFIGISLLQAQNVQDILNKTSAKIKNAEGITANFSYSVKDKNNVSQGAGSGNMTLKGNKYYIKQGVNEIFFDGKQVWNFNGSDEVHISAARDNEDVLTPEKIINADFKNGYTSKLVSSGGNTYNIELMPTDKRQNFTKINLVISKATNLISSASVVDKSGNTTTFTLSNIKTNVKVQDSKFLFDIRKHPGIEVIG